MESGIGSNIGVQRSKVPNYLSVTAKFFVVPETINLIFLPWYKVLLRPLALNFSCRWLPISQWAKDMVALTGIGMVLSYLLIVVPIERHSPFRK
jgi:hypothetical protein